MLELLIAPWFLYVDEGIRNASVTIPMATEQACEAAKEQMIDEKYSYVYCVKTGYPEGKDGE